MTLNVTPIGDNASLPSFGAETYQPDQLIAGGLKVVTANATITGGALLARGTVLGMVTEGSEGLIGTPVAASGNTGNGTIGSVTLGEEAQEGAYLVNFKSATTFDVIDPAGNELQATAANEYGPGTGINEIGFSFTAGGTGMVAGDQIAIIVAPSSTGSYRLCKADAKDGSQAPCAILVDAVDASNGDNTGGVYLMGEFNGNYIIYDSSWTLPQLTALLRRWSIFIKTPVTATDPTTSTGGAMGGDAGGTIS